MCIIDKISPSCPYAPQSVITLTTEGQTSTLNATVLELFEPFTLSCTMAVQVDDLQSSGLSGRYVLKMYDRRFAAELREHVEADPWDPAIGDRYRQFLQSEHASSFFKHCSDTPFTELSMDYDEWNEQEREAYLQFYCRKTYNAEVQVYKYLHDMQGVDIPRFFGQFLISSLINGELEGQHLDCPGILLEFVPGFALSDIALHAPRETWQEVCDNAVRIVNAIGDRDIRNDDVQPRNFIISKDECTGIYRPVMIDFGRCVFREKEQDDRDWGFWKAHRDEEGAIGAYMQFKLGDGYHYKRSEKSQQLRFEFKRVVNVHQPPDEYSASSSMSE